MRAQDPVQECRGQFVSRYGHEPVGVWSAPGRVNLIGEHTDYNNGFVLPFAIDRRTHVALAPREDQLVRVSSELTDGTSQQQLATISAESVSGWSAYAFATAWGLGAVGANPAAMGGFEAHFISDVPLGAGLSSSAALECSLALALADLWQLDLGREALVQATHRGENDIVGAPTGTLDQSASLLCETDAALFLDCGDGSHTAVPLALADAGLSILVIDTQVEHAHANGGYAERRASCERGARDLGIASLRDLTVDDLDRAGGVLDEETFRRVRHIVTENRRVLDTVALLRAEGPGAIGEVLVGSHASMRDDFEISVPELDLAVETATAAGALGARMTGGGFGGSAIALVADGVLASVMDAVETAFAERDHKAPSMFVVRAEQGARRDL